MSWLKVGHGLVVYRMAKFQPLRFTSQLFSNSQVLLVGNRNPLRYKALKFQNSGPEICLIHPPPLHAPHSSCLKQALCASGDVMLASQIAARSCRGVCWLGDACWLPKKMTGADKEIRLWNLQWQGFSEKVPYLEDPNLLKFTSLDSFSISPKRHQYLGKLKSHAPNAIIARLKHCFSLEDLQMLQSLREGTEGKLQMLLPLRKDGLDSFLKEDRVVKVGVGAPPFTKGRNPMNSLHKQHLKVFLKVSPLGHEKHSKGKN